MYWKVTKSRVTTGESFYCPHMYSKCNIVVTTVEYKIKQDVTKLTDEITFGHKVNAEVEIELGFGEGDISGIVDNCLHEMKPSESQSLSVNIVKPFGTFCEGDVISFTIKLESFRQATPLYRMTAEECLSMAQRLKDVGTRMFKDQRTHLAGSFYSKALKQLIVMSSLEDSQLQNDMENLLVACHSNLAACQLKQGLYNKVVENCSDALALDFNHLKALYRRSSAYLALQDCDRAQLDVDHGLRIDPSNRTFLSLKNELKKHRLVEDKLLSQRLSSMFTSS